jgi:hypothetical protein
MRRPVEGEEVRSPAWPGDWAAEEALLSSATISSLFFSLGPNICCSSEMMLPIEGWIVNTLLTRKARRKGAGSRSQKEENFCVIINQ